MNKKKDMIPVFRDCSNFKAETEVDTVSQKKQSTGIKLCVETDEHRFHFYRPNAGSNLAGSIVFNLFMESVRSSTPGGMDGVTLSSQAMKTKWQN